MFNCNKDVKTAIETNKIIDIDENKYYDPIHEKYKYRNISNFLHPLFHYTFKTVNMFDIKLRVYETYYGYYLHPPRLCFKSQFEDLFQFSYQFEDLFKFSPGCLNYDENKCVFVSKY